MASRPPLQAFRNLPVVPVISVHQHVAHGGPIWPDFAGQTEARHCRGGVPVDMVPMAADIVTVLDRPAVWGGFLDAAFGHFVAEHVPRLPFALQERPDDVYLFTVGPGVTRGSLAAWVWQVFDWIGLPPDQVHIVVAPVTARMLRVGGQAEMLPKVAPSEDYLDVVAGWAAAVVPSVARMLYVSRAGLAALGGGGHAGESYLVGLLQASGVVVINPANLAIAQQMAAYAGAEHIVFAEGSALHGRQLLGRLPQDITVLCRRPGRKVARAALTPRCDVLRYHDVTGHALMTYWKNGAERPDPALRFYHVAWLLGALRGIGLDLASTWDDAAYAKAAIADVRAWIAWHKPDARRLAEYRQTLTGLGLGAWDA